MIRASYIPVARVRRRLLPGTTFVGITGSAGKTTTKRLVGAVLATQGEVIVSPGTHNRHRAVAATILRTRRSHRFCVQELAAGGREPLRGLVATFRPDVGIVTNAGWDHFSEYRGPEGAAREKAALVEALPESGVAILNADDAHVSAMATATGAGVILFGFSADAELRAEEVSARWPDRLSFTAVHRGERCRVETRLLGAHWVHAVLAALATGIGVGVSLRDAAAAIAEVDPHPRRMSATTLESGITIVQDDWKAPVWTLPWTFEFLRDARASRRILVLGQLSDDPRKPRRLYPAVAREARTCADVVLLVGRWAAEGLRARRGPDDGSILAFETLPEAHRFLEGFLEPGDLVLIKATGNADHTERLVLARTGRVECWRTDCGRDLGCEDCRLLLRPERRHGT